MVSPAKKLSSRILSLLLSGVVAAALVGAATAGRIALSPHIGDLSPFMLYIAAVLIAGLVRGAFCGALVMLGGGIAGFVLFLAPYGLTHKGSILSLMLFWGVATPVLATANELRVQLSDAMARLTAALDRKGQNKIIS